MWLRRRWPTALSAAVLVALSFGGPAEGADPDQPIVPPWRGSEQTDPALVEEQKMLELERLMEEGGALGLYNRDDTTIVVVIPSSGSASFRASDARSIGVDVTIETADTELEEIAQIKEVALSRAWHPEADDYQAGAGFDPRIGKVRLNSDAPEYVFAYFEEHFPGKTVFMRTKLELASRMNDVEPHWGGARIIEPGFPNSWCTSGFSVKTSTGKHRMVTAGHCFPLDTSVRSPNGTTFGSVTRNIWWGSVGNADDMALVGKGTNDIQMGPSIYVGGSTGDQADVYSAGPPFGGTAYCFSGATTYENCGHVRTSADYDICGADPNNPSACHYDLQEFRNASGQGSCGGDSGAPFYLKSTAPDPDAIYIRGMVVLREPDPCSDNTSVWIETWPKIDSQLDVDIKTI